MVSTTSRSIQQATILLITTAGISMLYLEYKIVPERFSCPNNGTCQVIDCNLQYLSRNQKEINFKCNLTEQLRKFSVHLNLYIRRENGYKRFIAERIGDICQYYQNVAEHKAQSVNLFTLLFGELRNYTNINHVCPYNVGQLYLKNYNVGHYFLPAILPMEQYRLDIQMYGANKSLVFDAIVRFSIDGEAPKRKPNSTTKLRPSFDVK